MTVLNRYYLAIFMVFSATGCLFFLLAVSLANAADQLEQKTYSVSQQSYRIPDVSLIDNRGTSTQLRALLSTSQPVLLQFIFTTCSTICPVLAASFANAQHVLDQQGAAYRMISISIDPEHDTPDTLQAYASRFAAGEHWRFYTGTPQAVQQVLKAFDAYYPGNNKMYHYPFLYLRDHSGSKWTRIDGLISTGDLMNEFLNTRKLLAKTATETDG